MKCSNVSYDGTHGGFGYGCRNTNDSRILEFVGGLNLVICSTLKTKRKTKEDLESGERLS